MPVILWCLRGLCFNDTSLPSSGIINMGLKKNRAACLENSMALKSGVQTGVVFRFPERFGKKTVRGNFEKTLNLLCSKGGGWGGALSGK